MAPMQSLPALTPDWLTAAENATRNLGLDLNLKDLSPEHWQVVLHNVEERMRMKGMTLPDGWQDALERDAGRLR